MWISFNDNCCAVAIESSSAKVNDLIEAAYNKMRKQLENFDSNQLIISTTVDGPALRIGLLLTQIEHEVGYTQNDDEHPLFIRVKGVSFLI